MSLVAALYKTHMRTLQVLLKLDVDSDLLRGLCVILVR